MKSIAVFCGSSSGNDEIFMKSAIELGNLLAAQNIDLVYGGAKIGLMGAVADAVLKNNGKVFGVLPHFLSAKEIAHDKLTELILVSTMHERKTKMHELCEGIIALPGGFGTMEELFEILTWAQLGLHKKPIGLLNVNGFYDSLLQLIKTMSEKGFLKKIHQDLLLTDSSSEGLLNKMRNYTAPEISQWIEIKTT